MDCVFCAIVSGEAPAQLLYSDDDVVAFADLHPVAPTHVLLIPRRHYDSLADVPPSEEGLVGHLLMVARQLATEQGLDRGYRLVINTRADGGQTVGHLHLHLIGGRAMRWPPG